MPLISSSYQPSLLFKNGHVSTIYSGLIRRVKGVVQQRERLELPDGDFMDLDWSFTKVSDPGFPKASDDTFFNQQNDDMGKRVTDKVVVLLHGLEGNGQRPYITGSAKAFNREGFDACAVNFRGCSGQTNRHYRSYHSGATEDLDAVITHIIATGKYRKIYINGFSLGGNMALKYLGEGQHIPEEVKGLVAVSVPCSLYSSLVELLKPKNYLYAKRFKKHLVAKLRDKQVLFPGLLPDADINKIKTLKDFDDIYTSRAHGFEDALDYYQKCSCLQFLPHIRVPCLIVNADNDTFLGPECYPITEARSNEKVHLEIPHYGGHVGFYGPGNFYYNEERAINFLKEVG